MDKYITIDKKQTNKPAHNIIFAKAGLWCFYESLVQGSNSVFQMNICAKNPRLRKYENRYKQPYDDSADIKLMCGQTRQTNFRQRRLAIASQNAKELHEFFYF